MKKFNDFHEMMTELQGLSLAQAKAMNFPKVYDHNGYASVAKYEQAIDIRDRFGVHVISYIISEGDEQQTFTYRANGSGHVSYVDVELYLFCVSDQEAEQEEVVKDSEFRD